MSVLALLFLRQKKGKSYQKIVGYHYAGLLVFQVEVNDSQPYHRANWCFNISLLAQISWDFDFKCYYKV